jgi:hypothetical protein
MIAALPAPLSAAEGPTVAGPIGGNDVRSAQLPPPGLYGGLLMGGSRAHDFFDGNGDRLRAFDGLEFTTGFVEPFVLWVPDRQLFGGSIGVAGVVPVARRCGRLFETQAEECLTGFGDPYVEVAWSRYFGTPRPSRYAGAPPVPAGLTVAVGFGVLMPTGKYDEELAITHGLTLGNNIWDIAPNVAFTYVTPPILADGTEVSVKVYWNNYLTNSATDYWTGDLINADFAISERIGRVQAGLAGVYGRQVEDDELDGVPIPPDGRRVQGLSLGPVLVYDMPERSAAFKVKGLVTVITDNTPRSVGVVFAWFKRF